MITSIFEYREWGKVETFICLFLLAIFISEMAVIFLLGQEAGEVMAKAFISLSAIGVSVLGQLWKWIYKMVGPMLFPLLLLTFVEVCAIVKLVRYWRMGCSSNEPKKQYQILRIVEGAAPGFGFLGTCLSLISTMHHMDPDLAQKAMLKALLENSSSAFGSTVCGISLAITAFLSLELFKGFLIKPEVQEGTDKEALGKQDETPSMNLIKREV